MADKELPSVVVQFRIWAGNGDLDGQTRAVVVITKLTRWSIVQVRTEYTVKLRPLTMHNRPGNPYVFKTASCNLHMFLAAE